MCLSIFRNHYGDTLYSKMTSEFDPEGVAALSNRLGMCLVSRPYSCSAPQTAARPYVL